GTFEFTTAPQAGTTGNPTVTEGEFDIPITAGGAGVAPANKGSSFSGMFGTTPIYGAQATHNLISGTLTIILQDDTRTITIGIADMTGSNIYGVSATAPIRVILASDITGAGWNSNVTGGGGS